MSVKRYFWGVAGMATKVESDDGDEYVGPKAAPYYLAADVEAMKAELQNAKWADYEDKISALEKRITEVEGELADYKRLELLQRDRAFRAEQLLQALTYEKENTEKRLAEVVGALKKLLKSQWEHRCSDGVGGCTAISAAAIADAKSALTHAHEEEKK